MLLSRNKKNNAYPCKPKFHYIKGGFRGSKLYRYVFVMHSKVVPLLHFFCICASVVSHLAFVMSLFVPFLLIWCLGKAVLCDCDISWVSSHILFRKKER